MRNQHGPRECPLYSLTSNVAIHHAYDRLAAASFPMTEVKLKKILIHKTRRAIFSGSTVKKKLRNLDGGKNKK